MAKGSFILDNAIGKVGNVIVSKLTGSNNKVKTVVKAYQANVANPRTAQQANQRMKTLAAQVFYRGYRDLLDHSWQGTAYKARSYAKFLQQAMSDKQANIAFLDKGTAQFVPSAFLMSVGGLPSIWSSPRGQQQTFRSSLIITLEPDAGPTWGDISRSLLENQRWLRNGDWLTFVRVAVDHDNFIPLYYRVQININSQIDESSWLNWLTLEEGTGGVVYLDPKVPGPQETAAACVILSREPKRGSRSWQRSTARLELTDEFRADWCDDNRYYAALETYMSAEELANQDWYLNGGTQPDDPNPQVNPLGLVNSTTTVGSTPVYGAKFVNNSEVYSYAKVLVNSIAISASDYVVEPIILTGNKLEKAGQTYRFTGTTPNPTFITITSAQAHGDDFSSYQFGSGVVHN